MKKILAICEVLFFIGLSKNLKKFEKKFKKTIDKLKNKCYNIDVRNKETRTRKDKGEYNDKKGNPE